VILNVSLFSRKDLRRAVKLLKAVFASPFVMSDRVLLAESGDRIGEAPIPKGMIGLGTVCSVTMNGIFLKAGIPVTSKFGGVLEIESREAKRFISLISYEGSSIDPLEIFIKSGMTDANRAVRNGSGSILASFREVPVVCLEAARKLSRTMSEKGLRGVLTIGEPNRPHLDVPVGIDKAGVVIVGGLNPVAILEENGIPTESKAMSALYPFTALRRYEDAVAGVGL
jgi:repressor of nif and glnA expression